MQPTLVSLLVLAVVSSLPAQAGVAQYTQPAKDKYLSNAASTPSQPTLAGITKPAPLWPSGPGSFRQVHTTKSGIAGLQAGEFAMTLTLNSLNTFYTGRSSVATGVLLGKYDVSGKAPVFTPTAVAKTMNPTSGSVFGLMIEPRDGLYASVDWSAGPVLGYRATRSSSGVDTPFGKPVPMTDANGGNPLGTFVDPAVAYVDGKLVLLYVTSTSISMRPLTTTIQNGVLTKAVYGNATTVTLLTSGQPHSPTPVVDANGNVQGLFLAGYTGSDSDTYFQGLLSSKDTPIKMWDNARWQNNGAAVGGSFLFRNTADSSALWRIDAAYMVGSRTPLLGTATVSVFAKVGPLAPVVSTTLGASTALGGPIPIPGFVGQYGLGSVLLTFANISSTTKDEMASWTATVPNNPVLKGLRVPIQGLASPIGAPPGLTNTSHLEIL